MSLLLSSILSNSQRSHQPFLLLQSSTAQSCLPVLRKIIHQESHKNAAKQTHTLLLCFLHAPSSLIDETNLQSQGNKIDVLDYTDKVPGYDDSWADPLEETLNAMISGE
jgi:elongator complex protein 5